MTVGERARDFVPCDSSCDGEQDYDDIAAHAEDCSFRLLMEMLAAAESESFQRGFEGARHAALTIAENMAHSAYVASMTPGADPKAAMKAESLAFAAKTLADEIRALIPKEPAP